MSGRWPQVVQPELNFSVSLDLECYKGQPTDTAGYAPGRDQSKLLQEDSRAEWDKCTLAYGDVVNAKGRHSGVGVTHRCFPEGGDSILSIFSWEPLQAKL